MTPSTDVYDELASMFMTSEDDAPNGQDAESTTRITCEALIVGHLPVRAGLWLAPFADALAREQGPTALVRLDDEHPTLELLRGGEDALSEAQSLREAIERTASRARHWIVRGREGVAPEELVAAEPDRLTILTGADNAAVVRTYQIIKSLHHAAERENRSMPACGVAIIGADPEQATLTFERIRAATHSQLGVDVTLRRMLHRMDADLESRGFVRFDREASPGVKQAMQWIRAARQTVDVRPSVPGSPMSNEQFPDSRQPAADSPLRNRTMKLMPKPSMAMESKHAGQSHEPNEIVQPKPLADHVDGLTPIEPRCPRRESVELAVDARGDLHLLAREAHLRELRAVESWAHDHRELLSMACHNATLNPAANVMCHLFTESPKSVADLHGTSLHLHVLAPVKVGTETAWYAAPLNEPIAATV